jgi:alpha-mannosidase
VVERPIALRAGNDRYREMEVETKPQYTWTAVRDGGPDGRGLAVVSVGLPESAVQDLPGRPIALTLFRSFIKAFMTDGNEGGQMQGRHEFVYAIVPLNGPVPRSRLTGIAQHLAAPPRTVQLEPRDLSDAPPGSLPASHSFLTLTPGEAVITAAHRSSEPEGLVVRMFNPTERTIEEVLQLAEPVAAAVQTDLEGRGLGEMEVAGNAVRISLAPKQILTMRLG